MQLEIPPPTSPKLPGILRLPPEVMIKILVLLNVNSLLRLSRTCLVMDAMTDDDRLWKPYIGRGVSDETSWSKIERAAITLQVSYR
ncbi:hypothetical protein BC936DRAFT_144868 [Jimgerdemannia flammicorona]|uniref:Uncharacterized protein n=2 Tax=Jimgerdemannia flammicorona TaxID=994334 RepID=A0A433QU50_9FUNG|nr:hypothetical protein BC936DRAFT_144868 [Jimgerdemannia flammicorona]RUS33275.1 hypothetical protein BC938DRAFT_472270 [Jimgerdemannia flammicorona]